MLKRVFLKEKNVAIVGLHTHHRAYGARRSTMTHCVTFNSALQYTLPTKFGIKDISVSFDPWLIRNDPFVTI